MITQNRRHYLKTSQDVAFQFFGSPTVLHATSEQTDSRFCLLEQLTMPPGLASPYHRHHNEDEAFYVLEGQIVMQLKGQPAVTLTAGQTFYEGPTDVHVVGRNASNTEPARFVVVLLKTKGAPVLRPVNE